MFYMIILVLGTPFFARTKAKNVLGTPFFAVTKGKTVTLNSSYIPKTNYLSFEI